MNKSRNVFAPMTDPEFTSALEQITERGFDPAGFVLEERCSNYRMPGGSVKVTKLVSVTRIATGFQRQYSSEQSSGWPYEFGRDLGQLAFGARDIPPSQDPS
jgi:hypothetical protein